MSALPLAPCCAESAGSAKGLASKRLPSPLPLPPPTPLPPPSLALRSFVGIAGGNFLRGLIWGNVAALSQAAASSFAENLASATAAKQAISISGLKAGFSSRLPVFYPVIVG